MSWGTITKPHAWKVSPNLVDYAAARSSFSWDGARKELSGLPHGRGLNIAYEAVDRHAEGGLRDKLALRWIGRRGETRDFTFGDLRERTSRFANVLRSLGIGKGERVFSLCGRIPELYVAALGTLTRIVGRPRSTPSRSATGALGGAQLAAPVPPRTREAAGETSECGWRTPGFRLGPTPVPLLTRSARSGQSRYPARVFSSRGWSPS